MASKKRQRDTIPAYQEYASDMMARLDYRRLSFEERGLLFTLRLECWVNKSLPADYGDLAKVLGCPESTVAKLFPALLPFFSISNDSNTISCPELEQHRAHILGIRHAQSMGGKKTAAGKRAENNKKSAQVVPINQAGSSAGSLASS